MTGQEMIIKAQELAREMSLEELEESLEGKERTKVEHLACHFALQGEIDERVASKKATTLMLEEQYDKTKCAAELLYTRAKDDLRVENDRHREAMSGFAEEIARHKAEKERHRIIEAGFVPEKTKHTAERNRHAKVVVEFQKDAEPWRKMSRAEKEEARILQAAADKDVDDFVAEQS